MVDRQGYRAVKPLQTVPEMGYSRIVDTTTILDRLHAIEPELRRSGLGSLYLFGSRARGDHRDDSDIDLAFELSEDGDRWFSLLDQARLKITLTDALGSNVDFVQRSALRPMFREQVDKDLVRVF